MDAVSVAITFGTEDGGSEILQRKQDIIRFAALLASGDTTENSQHEQIAFPLFVFYWEFPIHKPDNINAISNMNALASAVSEVNRSQDDTCVYFDLCLKKEYVAVRPPLAVVKNSSDVSSIISLRTTEVDANRRSNAATLLTRIR